MAVEPAEAAQPQEPLGRDHAERVERGVEPGHVVPLRGEEDVAVGRVEAELGDVQLRPEQVRDEVERAEGGAEVPGAGALDRDERVRAAHVGEEREALVRVDVGRRDARELARGDQLESRHGVIVGAAAHVLPVSGAGASCTSTQRALRRG